VWHASVSGVEDDAARRLKAIAVLHGIGDAARGEWWEQGEIAMHLRRRLSAAEDPLVGPVVDVRGTAESARRLNLMSPYIPAAYLQEV
jgi:hypothetical protein